MHEFSVARSLLMQVNEIAAANGGGTIKEVLIRCGPLAGIEPLLLNEAFYKIRDQYACNLARLRIDEEPLMADCRSCGNAFSPNQFRFICPVCGSGDTVATSGDQIMIDNIVLDQPIEEHVL